MVLAPLPSLARKNQWLPTPEELCTSSWPTLRLQQSAERPSSEGLSKRRSHGGVDWSLNR
ncbi:hypothetical protein VR45_30745 [Streptomyces sp. NRRL S-495]|nr:hypothetical protein VR45_30745 [Streptomyces sp. NRRL S-495]